MKTIKLALACCAFATLTANAQTAWSSKINGETLLKKEYLTISYDASNKIPNYVGYFLTPDRVRGDAYRESRFYTDSTLPVKARSYSSNYTNSGYDRGHLSPAASWRFSQDAMHETFVMSNICPQKASFNRTWWVKCEDLERYYAMNCDTLYVITGTIAGSCKTRIKNKILVPEKLYKTCIGVHDGNVIISVGWIYANAAKKQTTDSCEMSIDAVEKAVGSDLYAGFWFNEKEEAKTLIP